MDRELIGKRVRLRHSPANGEMYIREKHGRLALFRRLKSTRVNSPHLFPRLEDMENAQRITYKWWDFFAWYDTVKDSIIDVK